MTAVGSGGGSSGLAPVIARLREMGAMPLDPWHVTAMLEMDGWGDADARRYGFSDLFGLSRAVYGEAAGELNVAVGPSRTDEPRLRRFLMDAWQFIRGVVFAMPMVVSTWASLVIGLSLWAYVYFDVPEATGIGIAVIASFLATGGFTQAMARRGLFLLSLHKTTLARRSALRFVAAGAIWAVVVGILMALVLWLLPVLSWETIRMALIYYPYLCLIWLFLGLLYMLQREFTFTAVVAVGIGIVYFLLHSGWLSGFSTHTAVIIAHAAALTWCALMSALLAFLFFRWRERREESETCKTAPEHWPSVLVQVYPFFLYGFFYFTFLFMDRLLAWSVPELGPQWLWFAGPYESGMNWAALALLLPMGIVELGIHRFSRLLFREHPGRVAAAQSGDLGKRMIRRWKRLQAALAVMGAVGVLLAYLLMRFLSDRHVVYVAPLSDPVSGWVFAWALLGYVLLAGGLLNVLMLFVTNQPWPAVQATIRALLTTLLVGFLASRFWYRCFAAAGCTPETLLRYPQAVVGFVAGAAVLWWLAGRAVRRSIDRADYLLYLNA